MLIVTRTMTLGGPIPVAVGTFDTRRKHEEPKVTTVTRMAALRRQKTTTVPRIATSSGPIPVTAGTLEKFGLGRGGTIPWEGWVGGVRSPGPGTFMGDHVGIIRNHFRGIHGSSIGVN